jgi:PAS domain S-box-containing protein
LALAPITRRAAWTILALSLASFFAVGFSYGMLFDTVRSRYSLNDLIGAVLVVASFIYLLDRLRYNSFEKSRKIQQQNEALRRSEEFSMRLIAASPDIVIHTNVQGEILFINGKGLEVSGSARKDIVGKNMLSFIAPEDIDAAIQNTILMMEQPLGPKEYNLIISEAKKSLYEVNGSVLKGEDGVPYGMLYIIRDISERKKAEEELRQSEEQYRLLAENCDDVIFTLDPELRFTYISPSSLKLRGLTAEEAMQEKLEETMKPASLDKVLDAYRIYLPEIEQGKNPAVRVELELYRKDGSTLWVESSLRPMRDNEGRLIGYLGVNRDISERKKQEDALQESERKYRFLIENSNDIIWTYDLKKMAYSFCSNSVEPILGYSVEESDGMTLNDIFSPETIKTVRSAFSKIIVGQATTDRVLIEAEHMAKDGRHVWMEINAVLQKDQDGKPVFLSGISRDITERKRADKKLKEAKEAAEAANQSKSVFLANMSHEIRTPMNAILGFAQLMKRDKNLSPQSLEHLEIINRSGEHLLSTINDILEMSKIEAGRMVSVLSTFDLYAMIHDLERMFRMRTDAKNLRFLVEKVGHIPQWVKTDEGKVRQVLINLLGNAVKFTEEGGIVLRLGGKVKNADTVELQFEVEDTGPGMAEDEIGRLFQAFEQSRSGLKSGGTGLGLALSQGFIQILGGAISVTSRVDKGTSFRFTIPVQEDSEEHAAKKEAKQQVICLKPGQKEIRILIADDRETNRQLLLQLLSAVGFATRYAVNGADAVQMVHEWRPQVVLMDMAMPVMDGYEAMRIIRVSPDIKETAIIAVTASAFEEDKKSILDAGADDYLSKPFKDAELFEIIGRLTGAEYLYEETGGSEKVAETVDDKAAMRKTVALLPIDLVDRLRRAVESADLDVLNELAGQLAAKQPLLVKRIQELAARYEYEALMELFSREDNP